MISVTDKTFKQEVLDFEGTVFVDFWADWCGPCKVMLPVYEKLSNELTSENVKFVKYEAGADDCVQILRDYNVSGLPTFVAFKQDSDPVKFIGAGDLDGFVRRNLVKND